MEGKGKEREMEKDTLRKCKRKETKKRKVKEEG